MYLTIQRLVVVGIIGLFPMFVYVLILIAINARRRASMIPGTWDCAGVLLATSGFVLGGGPLILAGLDAGHASSSMLVWPIGEFLRVRAIRLLWRPGRWCSSSRLAAQTILISRRRHVSVLYNVETKHVQSALEYIFGRLSITWQKQDHHYDLKLMSDSSTESGIVPIETPAGNPYATAVLTLLMLPANCNVTLIWHPTEGAIRRLVEGELSQVLPNIRIRKW